MLSSQSSRNNNYTSRLELLKKKSSKEDIEVLCMASPFQLKTFVKGVRCTAGSKILANYVPNLDATVVKKMSKAGAILIGTNNLNEFASGITGINPFYGTSKNPWDVSKISGGSSGGSAVAVATGMAQISLGTDTGGSIMVPS